VSTKEEESCQKPSTGTSHSSPIRLGERRQSRWAVRGPARRGSSTVAGINARVEGAVPCVDRRMVDAPPFQERPAGVVPLAATIISVEDEESLARTDQRADAHWFNVT
jgi:hypothetical protein